MRNAQQVRAQPVLKGIKDSKGMIEIRNIQRQSAPACNADSLRWSYGLLQRSRLELSAPDDAYEQEADQIAEALLKSDHSSTSISSEDSSMIHRKCGPCSSGGDACPECAAEEKEEEPPIKLEDKTLLQAKTESISGYNQTKNQDHDQEVPPIVNEVLQSSARPLDPATRAFFEPRFGQNFSQIRIHSDGRAAESANAVQAAAYTVGQDIVFASGRYAPETSSGRQLMAHELTHVVQQGSAGTGVIHRKLGVIAKSGCSVVLGMDIGIYGPRSNTGLAAKWQNWINTLWKGTAACHGNSTGACAARVESKVTAYPKVNWWWGITEANSAFVKGSGYRSQTNRAIDSGDWAEDDDDRSIAHEVGHLMGQGDKYWNIPWTKHASKSGFVNDIMANYYRDPGPTEYGPAFSRILEDHDIECLCCLKYPPCGVNNCALSPGIPCANVGERRHCEWIRANNTPEALAKYPTDCSTLRR